MKEQMRTGIGQQQKNKVTEHTRLECLRLAIAYGKGTTADDMVSAARTFEAYVTGGEA